MRCHPMAPRFPIGTNSIIMERKLIEQYGEDILSYRLRTARQKKRAQYEDFDKQLLKLDREQTELSDLQWNLGWEPVNPPYQKGWKRFFVLRDDVARSKHADFYAGILQKINTEDWSHRKDFVVRKRRYGTSKFVVKTQKLKEPDDWYLRKIQFTDAEWRHFHEVSGYDRNGHFFRRYVFNEPWRFVLRVQPHMITEVKRLDSLLASRIKEIDEYLERNGHRYRLGVVRDGAYDRWRGWWPDNKYAPYEFNNKSLSQIMDMIRET